MLLSVLQTQLLLVQDLLLSSNRSLSQDSLPPCLTEDQTWDGDYAISVHVDLTSVFQCQSVCSITNLCTDFTWNKVSHPHYPNLCLLFSTPSQPLVRCTDCISGPPSSSCTCSDDISCDVTENNVLNIQTSVLYEIECQMLCIITEDCATYSWYDDNQHPFDHMCFLFSECSQYFSCDGCHSGPPLCEDLSSSTTSTTTTTTTTTTTSMLTTTVSSICYTEDIRVLGDLTRSVKYEYGNYCDKTVGAPLSSPDWSGPGWYRFSGPDYTQMADYPPGENQCGTQAAGYLSGAHPSVEEGPVQGKVCFDWDSYKCEHSVTYTTIVNCGNFFIYNLRDTLNCSFRYCGM